MQDVKHLTQKKKSLLHRLVSRSTTGSGNAFKRQREQRPPRSRKRLAIFAAGLFLIAGLFLSLTLSTRSAVSSVSKAPPTVSSEGLNTWNSFQLAAQQLPSFQPVGSKLQAGLPGGGTITYAINPELQERVTRVMNDNKVPFGVFVALEPRTGKILAMASHSSRDDAWPGKAFYTPYPMASLFKIVTAAAALEEKKISPDTVMAFNGKLTSVSPSIWEPRRRHSQEMSLTEAMGKSVNPVFGRLASDVVGRDPLLLYAGRFGFNQVLFPGTQIQPSVAATPQNTAELMLMGAGLGREVKITPLHAASLIGAVANGGTLMAPLLADEIKSGKGTTVYQAQPHPLRRAISSETAGHLAKMLSTTVSKGTSRRAFHDRRGRPMLGSISIAAKTGSIDGKDPEGQYSWFAAYAPIENPQIALVALVVNQGTWKIKASHVGEKALEAFFR